MCINILLVPTVRLELTQLTLLPPQDSVSTNFTTSANALTTDYQILAKFKLYTAINLQRTHQQKLSTTFRAYCGMSFARESGRAGAAGAF